MDVSTESEAMKTYTSCGRAICQDVRGLSYYLIVIYEGRLKWFVVFLKFKLPNRTHDVGLL